MTVSKINLSGDISNNFQLIILETTKQVEETQKVLNKPNEEILEKIFSRDDFIDNLKSAIEKESFYNSTKIKLSKSDIDIVRSLYIIANNLERIADFAVNIVRQTEYLQSREQIHRFKYSDAFKEILASLKRIDKAFKHKDLNMALQVCRSEVKLDEFFSIHFKQIMEELKAGGEQTGCLITILFIFRYLERIGDSLLNIGEAIIFSIVGERVKIHHIESLNDSMNSISIKESLSSLKIDAILGTKSGCKISRVQKNNNLSSEYPVIFKEGKISKLEKEKQNIQVWETLRPGLPPRIFSFQQKGKNASILLEFLQGPTLQMSLLTPESDSLEKSTELLKNLLTEIWTETKEEKPTSSNFIKQLKCRISDIYHAHPSYNFAHRQIGDLVTHSIEDLIAECESLEKNINAPFSVWAHGDFNLDNIIFSTQNHQVHFIDLYRSGRQDYVQDISVFLVSIFRLPVFNPAIRSRMNQFALDFFKFGKNFARNNGDRTFEVRVALGLARSFFTSTRFEFDKNFSETMQQRAIYLMEKIASHNGVPWEEFKLVSKVLTY